MLGADVVVLQIARLIIGGLQNLFYARGHILRRDCGRGADADVVRNGADRLFHGDILAAQNLDGYAVLFAQQAQQQVLGADIAVAQLGRRLQRQVQGLAGPLCESVKSHSSSLDSFWIVILQHL